MVLPLGATVRIDADVERRDPFLLGPGFLYKHDAIPGKTFEFDLTPTQTGTFYGECAEFCGLNHAYMTFSVRVVEPSEFETWVNDQTAEAS